MKTIDVSYKFETHRVARARGRIRLSPETVRIIKEKGIPKGDVLTASQLAGMYGAKKTSELIPFCHPIPIDHIEVKTSLGDDFVEVEAEIRGVWRTGYEVEAVMAVAIALVNVYDMCKAYDDSMVIEGITLVSKSGGKSDWADDLEGIVAGIITVSDSVYGGMRNDESGMVARELLEGYGAVIGGYKVVPDDKDKIKEAMIDFAEKGINLIVTSGGTGFSSRDVTPEATGEVIRKEMDGFSEAMHVLGVKFTPRAIMSRSKAGFINENCMVINLPGSSKAVRENLQMIIPLVKHAFRMAKGGGH